MNQTFLIKMYFFYSKWMSCSVAQSLYYSFSQLGWAAAQGLVTTVKNRIRNGNGAFSAYRQLQGMGGVTFWVFLVVISAYHIGFVFKRKMNKKNYVEYDFKISL